MTLLQYNISNIATIAIVLIGCFWLLYSIINKLLSKKNNYSNKKLKQIMLPIFVVLLAILSLLAYQNTEYEKQVTVSDTISTGSIGDYLVNFTIYDDTNSYNSPVLTNRELRKKFEELKNGDTIIVKYDNRLNYVYDFSVVEK